MEYTITSTQNPAIKAIKKLSSAKERKASGQFLVEGDKCVNEALKVEGLCAQLLMLENQKEKRSALIKGFNGDIFWVSGPVMETISTVKTPQGITAVCKSDKLALEETEGLIVMLDGVSDPGNVGTIIRTADAAGATAVYTLDESADIYNPKVIRASMGSVFHIPVKKIGLSELIGLKEKGITLIGADLMGEKDILVEGKKICLVIGSEAHGLSAPVKDLLDAKITIPMFGQAESLNAAVAAGILIYKMIGY